MYEFTCGLCYKPKLAYETKICWQCSEELVDGVCINCPLVPATNSIVCIDCQFSLKKCKLEHKITKQSIAICKSCKKDSKKFCANCNSFTGNCCTKRWFCLECDRDLSLLQDNKCYKCKGNVSGSLCEKCKVKPICENCFENDKDCSCGARLLSNKNSCLSCQKTIVSKKFAQPRYFKIGERG